MSVAFNFLPEPSVVETEEDAKILGERLKNLPPNSLIAIDTETTGLSVKKGSRYSTLSDDILCWSIGYTGKELLFSKTEGVDGERVYLSADVLDCFLEPLFLNPNIVKIFHNIKYDQHCLMNYFKRPVEEVLVHPKVDTMVMHWLVDERLSHGLKDISRDYLGIGMTDYKKLFKGKETELLSQDKTTVVEYATLDAYVTAILYNRMKEELQDIPWKDNKTLFDYYWEIERFFTDVLFNMERTGILINQKHLDSISEIITKEQRHIQKIINLFAGAPINLGSPKQLADILYNQLKYPVTKMTGGGNSGNKSPSTSEETLNSLLYKTPKNKKMVDKIDICRDLYNDYIEEFPNNKKDLEVSDILRLIVRWKKISKIKSTYSIAISECIEVSPDRRLHPSFNGTVAVTGRLSSSKPINAQNIPSRKDEFKIRESFSPTPGNTFIIADYSQAEVRLIADLSGDEDLIRAIKSGDIYRQVYAEMFEKSPGEVTKSERNLAKVIVLGTNYLMRAFTLNRNIENDVGWENTPFADVQDKIALCNLLLDKYFGKFKELKYYLTTVPILARQKTPPHVRTLLGRYRRLPELIGTDIGAVNKAEREAVNTGPQGGVADILRGAMIDIDQHKRLKELEAKMLMQIHDEIVLEAPIENAEEVAEIITNILTHPLEKYGITFSLPLDIELIISDVWKKG